MGIEWGRGTVKEIIGERGTLQEVALTMTDGSSCRAVHDLSVFEPLRAGDEVLANTTAVSLGLGTGGWHFVHAPLAPAYRADNERPPGHIMKLRYTSLQRAVLAVEEQESEHHAALAGRSTLRQMPVLIGELHSMLPAAVCWLRRQACWGRELRIAYIMTDGAALPISFSQNVNRLNTLGWLTGTITYGHAYGGDLEAVNKYTALLAAKHVLRADIAIVTMGPGIVGTGTAYGYSGMETGELVNAVRALDGIPVYMPRISFHDERERHYGLSHHTRTALGTAAVAEALLPLPLLPSSEQTGELRSQTERSRLADKHKLLWSPAPSTSDMEAAMSDYGATVTSMGRGLRDDPAFFAAVCVAAEEALRLLGGSDP